MDNIETLTELIVQYGIFAGLFIALLVYTIRANAKREKVLTDTLKTVADKACLDIVEVKKNVQRVEEKVDTVVSDLKEVRHDVTFLRDRVK